EGQQASSASLKALNDALDALNNAIPALVAAVNAVGARVDAAAASNVFQNVAACHVADVDPGFSVTPDADNQTLPAGQSINFVVTSGTGIPRAALAGKSVAGVTLDTQLSNGSFLA